MTHPVISVCIANFNGEDFICECIDSVLNQDTKLDIEIIVHDDASTDNSITLIRSKYPQVKLIESKTNSGFCKSNNKMANIARGEYLLLLNNDAQLFPDALRALHDYASNANTNSVIGLPQYDYDNKQLLDIGYKLDFFLNPIPNKDFHKINVAMVIGACLWIPNAVWQQIGGFPEWFGSLAEDMYICISARLMGYPVIALDHSGFNHHVGKSLGGGKVKSNQLQTTYSRRKLSERNKSFVMIICYPGLLLLIIAPLHFLLLYLEGIALTIIKRDSNIWQSIYKGLLTSIWSHKNEINTLRKKTQATRKISTIRFLSVFVWYHYKIKMLFKHGLPILK